MVRGHKVDIAGLLGNSRNVLQVEDEVPIESFEGIAFERPASVRLNVRAASGWLEVRGNVRACAAAECDVCLEPVDFEVHVDVDERFDPNEDRDVDPFGEANVLVGSRFDVADLAQQVVLSGLPMGVRCPRHSEGSEESGKPKVEDPAQ